MRFVIVEQCEEHKAMFITPCGGKKKGRKSEGHS
jgi:hypothetical protein